MSDFERLRERNRQLQAELKHLSREIAQEIARCIELRHPAEEAKVDG